MSKSIEEKRAYRALLAANGLCCDCTQSKGDSAGTRCAPCTLKNRARSRTRQRKNKLGNQIAAVAADPEKAAMKLASMRAKINALTRFISQHGLNAKAPEKRAPHHTKYFRFATPEGRLRRLEEIDTFALNEDERLRIYEARRYWRNCLKRTA